MTELCAYRAFMTALATLLVLTLYSCSEKEDTTPPPPIAAYTDRVYINSIGDNSSSLVAVNDFTKFNVSGANAEQSTISGEGTFVDCANVSAGYKNASGGDAILFAQEGSYFVISKIETMLKHDFILSFGAHSATQPFSAEDLKLQLSIDAENWIDIPYTLGTGTSWAQAEIKFRIKQQANFLSVRWQAGIENSFRIDDIVLCDNAKAEGPTLDFEDHLNDNRPAGYLYFEDNLDWMSADFGIQGTPVQDFVGGDRPYIVGLGWGKTYMDPTAYATLKASAWDNFKTPVPPENILQPTAIYMCIGAVQLSNVAGERYANIISPKLARRAYDPAFPTIPVQAGIAEGKKVDVIVSVTASGLYTAIGAVRDIDRLTVKVHNQGTIMNHTDTEVMIEMGVWNQWRDFHFKVYGATSETQIIIGSEQGALRRVFFSGMKVVKAN